MEYDREAAARKREELIQVAVEAALDQSVPVAQVTNLVDNFVRITPPEKEQIVFELIVLKSGRSPSGRSVKPGNIVLSWRKIMKVVPTSVVAFAGGMSLPAWVLPFLALQIWVTLQEGATEEFSSVEAMILIALWNNKNEKNRIEECGSLASVNKYLLENEFTEISSSEYANCLDRLAGIGCIEIDSGEIWLREWIRRVYR